MKVTIVDDDGREVGSYHIADAALRLAADMAVNEAGYELKRAIAKCRDAAIEKEGKS